MKNLKYTPESSCSYLQKRFKQNFCKSIPLGVRASGAKKSQVEKVKWMKHERLTLMGIFQCSNLSLIDHFFQDSDQLYQAQDLQAYFGTSFEEFDGLVVSESIFEIEGNFFQFFS